LMEAEREQWIWRVIRALNEVFPDVQSDTGHATRKQAEQLLPHALLCLYRASAVVESPHLHL
jgi:hypothetical protein